MLHQVCRPSLYRRTRLLALTLLVCGTAFPQDPPRFVRGDADVNRTHDVTDVLTILQHLFLQQPERLDCEDAADANDDGAVNLTDALSILFYLYEGGPLISEPVLACGKDPTADDLGCESFWVCGTGSFRNVIGMRFMPVPAGEFEMGSPPDERGRYPDEDLHTVALTCPFFISATEVTQGQYRDIVGVNPSYFNGFKEGVDYGTDLNRPVDSVSWHDAVAFCRRLSDKDGRRYRLPYEAEWEYACRGGTTTRFWFGDLLECPDEVPQYCPSAEPFMLDPETARGGEAVAQRLPNPFGLFDMHGLSYEWCLDWYGPYSRLPVINPKGPVAGSKKVIRGRSGIVTPLREMRSARRYSFEPYTNNFIVLGFRVVAELPDCRYGYQ